MLDFLYISYYNIEKTENTRFGYVSFQKQNIIDNRRFEISTPDVSIKVNPERSDLIQTRIIGGVKYIMICADENVEVNGVPISIEEDNLVNV